MTAVSDEKLRVGRRVQLTNKPDVTRAAPVTGAHLNRQTRQEAVGERRRQKVGSEECYCEEGGRQPQLRGGRRRTRRAMARARSGARPTPRRPRTRLRARKTTTTPSSSRCRTQKSVSYEWRPFEAPSKVPRPPPCGSTGSCATRTRRTDLHLRVCADGAFRRSLNSART